MELEKIKAIIAEVLNIDADSITEDTTFVDDLGAVYSPQKFLQGKW